MKNILPWGNYFQFLFDMAIFLYDTMSGVSTLTSLLLAKIGVSLEWYSSSLRQVAMAVKALKKTRWCVGLGATFSTTQKANS